jgi:preprotein translocase subunit YajC
MESNWYIMVVLGAGFIFLLIFLFRRNQKDRRDLEKELNRDYKKPVHHKNQDDIDLGI